MEEMQRLPKPKVFISIGPGENGGKGAPRGVCQSYSLSLKHMATSPVIKAV